MAGLSWLITRGLISNQATTPVAPGPSDYSPEHASALVDIRAAGNEVTFSSAERAYSMTAGPGASTTTATTVSGAAVGTRGNPRHYAQLGLVEERAITLLFAPDTFGELPELGMVCTWAGEELTVKAIDPIWPDGTTVIARVVVAE